MVALARLNAHTARLTFKTGTHSEISWLLDWKLIWAVSLWLGRITAQNATIDFQVAWLQGDLWWTLPWFGLAEFASTALLSTTFLQEILVHFVIPLFKKRWISHSSFIKTVNLIRPHIRVIYIKTDLKMTFVALIIIAYRNTFTPCVLSRPFLSRLCIWNRQY